MTTTYAADVLPSLRPECLARAEQARTIAERLNLRGQLPYPDGYSPEEVRKSVSSRLVWSVYAAGEFLRPFLSDVIDAAALRPELADEIWHQAAGAAIVGTGCGCTSPAEHRANVIVLASLL